MSLSVLPYSVLSLWKKEELSVQSGLQGWKMNNAAKNIEDPAAIIITMTSWAEAIYSCSFNTRLQSEAFRVKMIPLQNSFLHFIRASDRSCSIFLEQAFSFSEGLTLYIWWTEGQAAERAIAAVSAHISVSVLDTCSQVEINHKERLQLSVCLWQLKGKRHFYLRFVWNPLRATG